MMEEFMASMSEEERTEMMRLMMPIMMKDMKPNMMAKLMGDFSESDCKKMMMEMPPEIREKCRKMMISCLKTLKEI
jgi:hypothetical protein